MSTPHPASCPVGALAPLCIALVGLTEGEASCALPRLDVALPDATVVRFDTLSALLTALAASRAMSVVVVGSSLADDERRTAAERSRCLRPDVAVLDLEECQAGAPTPVPQQAPDDLAAVAVRAALRRQPALVEVPALREADVAAALAGDQLELHYQPVVDLLRGEVVGVEALLRWRHPELGLLPPEVLVPLAESTGLVVELGRWVLRTACRQAASWHRQGLRLEMAVNVCAQQVTDPEFVDDVRQALAESALAPQYLLLEVSESAVMQDAAAATAALMQIRETGASIAIDDFGTGYSSLLHLKRYPISALKVDASFVAGLGSNPDDDAIVATVVNLAAAVGAVCTAAGVETVEQHRRLLALRCERAQGFLFSPPVAASQLPAAVDAAEERAVRTAAEACAPRRRAPAVVVSDDVLTYMMRLHDAGSSYPTIAAALNQMGSLHPKGTRWHRTSVARFIADLVATRQPVPGAR